MKSNLKKKHLVFMFKHYCLNRRNNPWKNFKMSKNFRQTRFILYKFRPQKWKNLTKFDYKNIKWDQPSNRFYKHFYPKFQQQLYSGQNVNEIWIFNSSNVSLITVVVFFSSQFENIPKCQIYYCKKSLKFVHVLASI